VDIERVVGVRTAVGESPAWDPATGSLWLIDILGPTVIRLDASGDIRRWRAPAQVGAVAPLADGRVAVALAAGFCILDPRTSVFSPLALAGCAPGAVLSEGGIDPQGRFVATSGDSRFERPIGGIHRWESDGSVRTLESGLVLGNGTSWSLDGGTFYVADSMAGEIYAYDYDGPDGGLGARRVFFSSRDEAGFPDGSTVDAEDHLWVVLHQSPWLIRLDPGGRIVGRIELPVSSATSIAFGGEDLDELYVTSVDPTKIPGAQHGPVDRENDGRLFRITGTGFVGAGTKALRAGTAPSPSGSAPASLSASASASEGAS
jgi:sugar lactone lactonase YvrE